MAFKGLSDRFEEKAAKLYNHGSTRDAQGRGVDKNSQPFLEWKPNDPDATEQTHDTRFFPVGAVKRDAKRVGKFLASNTGLLFLAKQQALQLGNTFSETQLLNPLFVIGNVVPALHLRRPLTVESSFQVRGDSSQASFPTKDPKIFGAGRLQVNTSKEAVANVTGRGNNSLISLLPPTKLISSIAGIFSLKDKGSLGVNARPELDVAGQYFSVMMWQGYVRNYGSKGALDSAAAALRTGNIKGAISSVKQAGKSLLQEIGLSKVVPALTTGKGSTLNGSDNRYFITDARNAIRYVKNSVIFDGERPYVNLAYLDHKPYSISKLPAPVEKFQAVSKLSDTISSIRNAISFPVNFVPLPNFTAIASIPTNKNDITGHVTFPQSTLQELYKTEHAEIGQAIDAQQQASFNHWKDAKNKTGLGSTNRYVNIGMKNDPDPHVERAPQGYVRDSMNVKAIFDTTGEGLAPNVIKSFNSQGSDLINVIFHDIVNTKAIPFRAFIKGGLKETIIPEYTDTRYIGRTERNIMYSGVSREISFVLIAHAFHPKEMTVMWEKINYMTGLCYPAAYSEGFMVPPLIRFTLGGLYKNQPGYIRSLTHDVEEGTVWDVDEQVQAPTTVTMTFAISLIDAQRMTAGKTFYPVGI